MLTLFCDESGFTGQDLLNRDQPFFSYSSVLIEPAEAAALIEQARADHKLGTELKGSRMIGNTAGREAAEFLFDNLIDRSITVVADKKFCLAGKLYEYIFDPVVEGYQGLYEVGFHNSVTNLLHQEFTGRKPDAVHLLSIFQQSVRKRDFSEFTGALAGGQSQTKTRTLARKLRLFCPSSNLS